MSTASQQTWTEPPWTGWIETTGDALLILEAARRGLIPRVTRRLVDSERKMITSGSVFVFDEDESGIKRWTDGFFWSPSRILGNFLLYRETDKRGPGHKGAQAQDAGDNVEASQSSESYSLSRPKTETGSQLGFDKLRERTLMGSLTNSYKFKADGLMKKTFSLNIDGVAQHLISYYRIEDVENGRLRSPSSLPELASLDISPEYLDKTHFRNPPKVEVGPDGVPRYRGEADDVEASNSSIISAPLSTGPPLLTDSRIADNGGSSSTSKRPPKRYEPYSTTQPSTKRHRKRNGKTPESPLSDESSRRSASQTPTPTSMHPPPLPSPYSDPNGASATSTSSTVIQSQPGYPSYYPAPGYGHPQTGPVYPYPPQGPSPSSYSPPYGGNGSTPANPGPYYGVGYYPAPPYAYGPTWPSFPGYQHAPLPPPPHATVTEEKNEEHESQS